MTETVRPRPLKRMKQIMYQHGGDLSDLKQTMLCDILKVYYKGIEM